MLHLEGALESVLFEWHSDAQLFLEIDGTSKIKLPLASTLRDFREGHVPMQILKVQASIPLANPLCSSRFSSMTNDSDQTRILRRGQPRYDKWNRLLRRRGYLIATKGNANSLSITKAPSGIRRMSSWLQNTRNAAARSRKTLAIRCFHRLNKRQKKPLWLYYDRGGVGGDKRLSSIHPRYIKERWGRARYYVSRIAGNRCEAFFTESQLKTRPAFRIFQGLCISTPTGSSHPYRASKLVPLRP